MAIIDIDALLIPVSEALPAGENLEYSEMAELQRLSTGTPGKLDPETRQMVGGEEPEWRKVRDAGTALFAQTKDLRAAVILVRSLLALNGLQGLGEGMKLVGRLCEEYWDTVHPVLDVDEGSDPIERLNALANLDDAEGLINTLRASKVVESREAGSYTVRKVIAMYEVERSESSPKVHSRRIVHEMENRRLALNLDPACHNRQNHHSVVAGTIGRLSPHLVPHCHVKPDDRSIACEGLKP